MSVRVVARLRPLLDKELEKDTIVSVDSGRDGNLIRIPNPRNESEEFSFAFNGVYDMSTTQEELFTNEVAPTLKSLFQGLDVTIFAYGVTGTGKTHTMRGGLKLSERGVIPRLLSGIYRRARKAAKDSENETSVAVSLSYYEIYNDKVFDLFESPDKRTPSGLPLREKDGKTIVVGLTERPCNDLKDFESLYIEANNNRSTAGTKLNAQSSRSHAILMVKITQTTGDETRTSTASAIDLAGSEDNRRTENGKERMVESASINKSLFVLSQCIDAIGRGDKRIPFRESKMTRILSLGQNNGITIMILNLAPLRSYHLDTLSSLNVSSRAKRIEVREIENEVVFKQPPRTTSSLAGSTIQRQPLRPLANAHNVNIAAGTAKPGDKPIKAFSVYSDGNRTSRTSNTAPRPAPPHPPTAKRPSDTAMNSRPLKMIRPNAPAPLLSAAKIEEIIEQKVSQILASRAPAETMSETVQRRLDALEKKIEENGAEEDARSEGLRFLLMAKQHKEHGQDSSALKMYELALPYFPNQEKLLKKIENLRAKIKAKKEAETEKREMTAEAPKSIALTLTKSPARLEDQTAPKPKKRPADEDDEDFNPSAADHSLHHDDDDNDSFSYKPSSKARKPQPGTQPATALVCLDRTHPGVTQILNIINSRDANLIKGLTGIGPKKARDIVEFLELRDDDEGGRIESLEELSDMPGVGRKRVYKMMEAIGA